MKKFLKILAGLAAIGIIFGILVFANGLLGNPVSKKLAEHAAKDYLVEHYADRDFIIEDVTYNFKFAAYHARITSPSSIDTYFSLTISMLGQVEYDTYDSVLNGWNTYQRIDEEYRQMVDAVFSSPDFPLISDIDFGELAMLIEDDENRYDGAIYGIKQGELELDKPYDVKELAKTAGHIVFYAQNDEISFQKASELLLTLKENLDKAGVPFYAIDFVLEKPRNEDGSAYEGGATINIANYLYRDIVEEGLAVRLEKAHNALMDYYAEQDAKTKLTNVN